MSGLQHLRFAGHEVTVFHILHNDELELPFNGMTRFDGLEMTAQLLTRPVAELADVYGQTQHLRSALARLRQAMDVRL